MRYLALVLVAALLGGCSRTILVETSPPNVGAVIRAEGRDLGQAPALLVVDFNGAAQVGGTLNVEAHAKGYRLGLVKVEGTWAGPFGRVWPERVTVPLLPEEQ